LDDSMKVTDPSRRETKPARRTVAAMENGDTVNTHAQATHPLTRSATTSDDSRVHTLRVAVRRLASWWNDDPMTARFAAARERDQRLLQRISGR
jgi:hypothetical protein